MPMSGRRIRIIADEYVDREFGTGALKITPGGWVGGWVGGCVCGGGGGGCPRTQAQQLQQQLQQQPHPPGTRAPATRCTFNTLARHPNLQQPHLCLHSPPPLVCRPRHQ